MRRSSGLRSAAFARRALFYTGIALLMLYIGFPIYWTLISSFKTPVNFFEVQYWPTSVSLQAYSIVLADPTFRRSIYVSLIVCSLVVVLTLALGALAGYAIARLRFRGRNALRYAILVMIVVPQIAFLGGLFVIISNPCSIIGTRCPGASLYNTIWALIGSYPILTLPLTAWFLVAYYHDLPTELEEAARVDGATLTQSFFHIMLPLAAPALVTTGLLSFITAWNEFLFAVTFSLDETSRTAPVRLSMFGFVGFGTILSLAGSIVLMAPVILLVLAFGPQITTGLTGLTSTRPAAGQLRQRLDQGSLVPRFSIDAPTTTLLVVLVLGALVFGQYGWNVIRFPFPADYGEGPLLAQTIQLADAQNIYRADLSEPPYTVANYPPLYMLVLAPFARLFGPAFWYGRLVSWLSMLTAALLVGAILHTLTGDRLAALLCGLSLLTIPYVSYWAPLYRIDGLALALSLGGLYVIVRWPERRWGVYLAALLLTAAVFTRQSYGLAAPLAAFTWLLARRPRRRAFVLAGAVAGVGLGLFALTNLATGGGFWFNIITANVNEFQPARLRDYVQELWILMPFAVAGTVVFVLAGWRSRTWPLIAPYCVGAALAGLTIGKVGSNVNYLLEFSVAMCLALGATMAGLRPYLMARQALMAALAIQFVLLVPGSNYQMFTQFKLAQRYDLASLQRLVNSTSRPVLADEDMGLLVLDGRPLVIQPFEATQLARAGVWDQRPFLEALDRQEFAAILIFRVPGIALEKERWTPEMLQEIARRYQPTEQIGNTIVYRPKRS
jgi:ABC-type glycerol-3-phosphate transport system permease component